MGASVHGNMGVRQHGNMGAWERGNMGALEHGNLGAWVHGAVCYVSMCHCSGCVLLIILLGSGNGVSTPRSAASLLWCCDGHSWFRE